MSFCMRWAQGTGASVMIAATEAMTVESGILEEQAPTKRTRTLQRFDDDEVEFNRSDDDGQRRGDKSHPFSDADGKKNPRDDYVILTQLRLRSLLFPRK